MNNKNFESRRTYVGVAVGVMAFLAIGILLEHSAALRPLKGMLQAKHAHRSSFPGNRTLRLFNQMGVIHAEPDKATPRMERLVSRDRKRGGTVEFWGVEHGERRQLPSTEQVPPYLLDSGVPILSIYLENREWRLLRKKARKRGRDSERTAFVSFFDDGQLIFNSGAGVRPHGGRSRSNPKSNSFRLYLRGAYGDDQFPPLLIDSEQISPLRKIVLRPDRSFDNFGVEWHMVTPLAYDIARQAGAIAPQTRPVDLIVNRKRLGTYVLTEYLDETYIESKYGHQRFTFVRTKLDGSGTRFKSGDFAAYRDFEAFAASTDDLSLAEISERVDLDNLSRWFISMIICGNSDAFQGPLVLDQSGPVGKWFWINWDMDNSFMSAGKIHRAKPWEFDAYVDIVTNFHKDQRSRLLRSLIRHQPEYRTRLLRDYAEIVNHLVTDDFLTEKVSHYEGVARYLGLADLSSFDRFREFFTKRAPIVRQRLGARLNGGPSHRVSVSVPTGRSIEIDGFPKNSDYTGWYYETVPIELRVPVSDRGEFDHWIVNSRVVRDPILELDIATDLTITAVYSKIT